MIISVCQINTYVGILPATDPVCIMWHTQTVSKHTVDNTVLFSIWNMIWYFHDCLGHYNSTI